MSHTRTITLRLHPDDYERLEAEAGRVGVAPATLARVFVQAGLSHGVESEVARKRRIGLSALHGLAELRDRLPESQSPVDVVELLSAGRRSRAESLDS